MQGDAGAGIITPDQESATRVGAAQGHSHQLGRGNCTTPLKLIFCHKNNWYGMVDSISWCIMVIPLGIVWFNTTQASSSYNALHCTTTLCTLCTNAQDHLGPSSPTLYCVAQDHF